MGRFWVVVVAVVDKQMMCLVLIPTFVISSLFLIQQYPPDAEVVGPIFCFRVTVLLKSAKTAIKNCSIYPHPQHNSPSSHFDPIQPSKYSVLLSFLQCNGLVYPLLKKDARCRTIASSHLLVPHDKNKRQYTIKQQIFNHITIFTPSTTILLMIYTTINIIPHITK